MSAISRSLPSRPASALPRLALLPLAAALLAACDGDPVDWNDSSRYEPTWTWINGHAVTGTPGVYGSLGVPASTNLPGAREGAVTWVDADGAYWLFGGIGYDAAGTVGRLNDLWKTEGNNWVWIAGDSLANPSADYGTEDVAAAANHPGGRSQAFGWTSTGAGADGTLWLFGGNGFDAGATAGRLSDLWQFDPATGHWTWVDGSNTVNQPGSYGTLGTADPANVPGGRYGASGWVDDAGRFWLFGGTGYDSAGSLGWLNDLWVFDGSNWTWKRGASTVNAPAVYATADEVLDDPDTVGVDESAAAITADMLTPSGRQGAASWHLPDPDVANVDNTETGWLFGGVGNDDIGNRTAYAEMWRFNGTDWTFAHGVADLGFTPGHYGARGSFSLLSQPPSRSRAVAWTSDTTLWLFGGRVEPAADGTLVYPNDLWRFDAVGWTWVGGNNTLLNAAGDYPAAPGGAGLPAGREGGVGWNDAVTGGLWLFGGSTDSAIDSRDDFWFFAVP